MKDETPIKDAPRRIPIFKRDILDEEVKKLKEKRFKGQIVHSLLRQFSLGKRMEAGECLLTIEH